MKKLFLAAPVLAALFAAPVFAAPLSTTLKHDNVTQSTALSDTVIGVETHRNPVGVIATDALYGGLAGGAIGAGVALLQNDGNWGRDIAVGAGVGLIAGGIFGAVDAAANADRVAKVDLASRNRGFGSAAGPAVKF